MFFCVFESNRAILDVIGTVPAANIICIRDQALSTFVIDFLKARDGGPRDIASTP